MSAQPDQLYFGSTPYIPAETQVSGEYVTLLGEPFYRIRNYDAMPPFFMSIVSSSDHWLFISTTGGLSAGRVHAEYALFPYYTVDKISENSENTGSKTFFRVTHGAQTRLWEPFSDHYRSAYRIERNLYKNIAGTVVVFEEINHDLALQYRYAWRTSDRFGFVKTSWLANTGGTNCTVELVDGLQNLLPANATTAVQTNLSVLLDAYKRNELEPQSGLGIFTLSSILTDVAEPTESLKATTVWQTGLDPVDILLSSAQLNRIRTGRGAVTETDIRGERGAYFVHTSLNLAAGAEQVWHLVAEVNQDSLTLAHLVKTLTEEKASLCQQLEDDIALNTRKLETLIASSDGLQTSGDHLSTAHHFANVLFNVMRGGVFADQYTVHSADLRDFITTHNRHLLRDQAAFFAALPPTLQFGALLQQAKASGSPDLLRLCSTYLPLTFSRRHGDPSRPWNRFAINVRKADGSLKLDYEGNWRDIFQNWEALAYSYPEYIEGMIGIFLNATTADGYNPYRVTRSGIEWEVPEPSNPWANIGYWSDHQIIYLQKLLEVGEKFHPGRLVTLLARPLFTYANVPYRIKAYDALLKDPYATIIFDWQQEKQIEQQVSERGSDGKLVLDQTGGVFYVTLTEKLLTLLLAKLVNFVPEGGIWMNTQRPEWNDANNALVGKGLSVVTVAYLRRFMSFFSEQLAASTEPEIRITQEVETLFRAIGQALEESRATLAGTFTDPQRRTLIDRLGQAGSAYRWNHYEHGFSGTFTMLPLADLREFLTLAQQYVEHTLRANQRADQLYHAYNTLSLEADRASIKHLYEMLEGQVAILSSGLLTAQQSLELMQAIRQSALYRANQHSYMLYPNRSLPGFLEKNCLAAQDVSGLKLVTKLVSQRDHRLVVQDINGVYHFAGHLRNAKDAARVLAVLGQEPDYAELVTAESENILTLFERVFHHDAFTGRSGTFFAYEGLGSIYWHMVSKYLLAAQEAVQRAALEGAPQATLDALIDAYFDIRHGIGFNKAPEAYGAFPTDPYSHTPEGQGAKQPGMTGMVKEEIITRMAELGLYVEAGELVFNPLLLRTQEFLAVPSTFHYLDVTGAQRTLDLPAGSLAFTFCQVPVIVQASGAAHITLTFSDGQTNVVPGSTLAGDLSQHIFQRDGVVQQLIVSFS